MSSPTDFNQDHSEVKYDSVKEGTRIFVSGRWQLFLKEVVLCFKRVTTCYSPPYSYIPISSLFPQGKGHCLSFWFDPRVAWRMGSHMLWPGNVTFLGCFSSVSKQNTESHPSQKLQVSSWNINVIITVQLIVAKAHLKIITAFHLSWVLTLLKCIVPLEYFFVRGKINGERKMKEFGKNVGTKQLLNLDHKVS